MGINNASLKACIYSVLRSDTCRRFQTDFDAPPRCAGWVDDTARTASHRDLFWPAAYGTVRCQGEVHTIVWKKDELFALVDAQPEMRQAMDHVIVEAIMRRLLSNPDGANMKDYLRVISQSWAAQEVRKRKIRMMETRPPSPSTSSSLISRVSRS